MEKSQQAQIYSKNSLTQQEDGLKLISQLCPQEGMKVLDLGCGTGYLSNVWAERVGQKGKVVAVDPDNERLKIAKETYGTVSNIAFQEGSTDEFPEDQYDIVYTNFVMHWVKDKETAFKNIYKNLKPGGSIGIRAAIQHWKIIDQLNGLMEAERVQLINDKLAYVSCETYKEIAQSCGFSLQFEYQEPQVDKYRNIEEFLEWWHGVTHGVFNPKLIDPAKLEEFKMPFGDKAVDVEIAVLATLIFVKPVTVSDIN